MFSREEIRQIFNIDIGSDVRHISLDSRDVKSGDLFIAIKGENFNGEDYVNSAFANGAAAAITSNDVSVFDKYKRKLILAKNPVLALQKLGEFARKRLRNTKVVGITGSVGKTTTKAMLAYVLSKQKKTYSSIKNFNSQIGLPVCLSMIPENSEYAVIEMGMSHLGELENLTKIANPNISIITAVGENHLEFFKDISEIAKAKSEIIKKGQEFCILPFDSNYYDVLSEKARIEKVKVFSFGEKENADIQLKSFRVYADKANISFLLGGKNYQAVLNSTKKSFAYSALICLLCASKIGISLEQAIKDISEFLPLEGRGNIEKLALDSLIINDCYNASPSSIKDSLESLKFYDKKSRVVVLGDVGELGDNAKFFHEDLVKSVLDSGCNFVYLFGHNMYNLFCKLDGKINVKWEENIAKFVITKKPNTVYLLKASHFMQFEKLVQYIQYVYNRE